MRKRHIAIIVIFAALLYAVLTGASITNVYVAQSSAGTADGSSCANAKAVSFFNTAGNWGSVGTQIGQDTTVHLCGTITTALTAQGSGASGHVIRIQFETGAKVSLSNCGTSGCISVAGQSYIQIDGSPTSTACGYVASVDTACNGIIEATNVGTGLGSSESIGIGAQSGASNIEVRNLQIRNMYVHTEGGADGATGPLYYCIHFDGANDNFHNLILHDCWSGVTGESPNSNLIVANSQIYNINWGVFLSGSSTVNGITGAVLHDNDIHDFRNWDDHTNNAFHHDGFIIAGNDNLADGINGVDIYNNYIHGTASSPTCQGGNPCITAFIFVNDANHVRTFNNVLAPSTSGEFAANGWIFYWSPGTLQSNDAIMNNTVLGQDISDGGCIYVEGDASMRLENNIASNCAYLMWMETTDTWTALNNNLYQGSSLQWRKGGSFYSTLANWRTGSGGDAAGIAQTGSLNLSSFKPLVTSSAVGAGANLNSLSITALNSDAAGVARPSSAAWDIGAYQYVASSAPIVSFSPTSIAFGNIATGSSSSGSVVTLSNTGTATLNISGITFSGTNTGDFSKTTTCGATVAQSANCTITATFTPLAVGARSASISVADDAAGTPQTVPMTGTGTSGGGISFGQSGIVP